MSKAEGGVFLDRFVEQLKNSLDKLGESGQDELISVWCEEYESVRRGQVAHYVQTLVAESGLNYEVLAKIVGARGRSFVCEAQKGSISLEKLQRLADFCRSDIEFPARSSRFVPATIKAMSFVQARINRASVDPSEEEYEYTRRASRLKRWWQARDDGDPQRVQEVGAELMAVVHSTVTSPRIREIPQLTKAVDTWVMAYLVCLSSLSEYGVD